MLTEQEIQVRWPDLDSLGHVNHSVVLAYLEVGRDAVLATMNIGPNEYVVRHCAIDYVGELRPSGATIRYRCTDLKAGDTSITCREALIDDTGAIAVKATFTLVMWDPKKRTSRRLSDAERHQLALVRTEEEVQE